MINFTLKIYLQINDWKVLGLHEKYLLAFIGVSECKLNAFKDPLDFLLWESEKD